MVQTLFGSGEKKTGFFERLRQAVSSTKEQLVGRVEEIVEGRETVDVAVLDELEVTLLGADLGVKTTTEVLDHLREDIRRRKVQTPAELREALRRELLAVLEHPSPAKAAPPQAPPSGQPEVIFVVGVNGVGKTTSIAKLAHFYREQGRRPLLAAADTFRAAANEQLEIWAGRLGIEIIKQKSGADPAAVVFDALSAAKKRRDDPVIVDTAGRLHTKTNLMAELTKMCRIAGREVTGAPHQVLLVLDATTGQNGLQQARQFTEHTGTTGVILTKLDGTAKGGVIVAVVRELGVPIQFVGVGEKVEDLLPFNPKEFVESLFEG
jgi:fused signal recognition particle receptor